MTHGELVNVALSCHGPLFGVAIAAHYKYGDRTEISAKSLQGTEESLRKIRQKISSELGDRLKPVFENPGSVPTLLVPDGGTYVERPVNPVGSEAYREAIQEFAEKSAGAMADCRSLLIAKNRWFLAVRILSWAILGLLIWQCIAVSYVAIVEKVLEICSPDWLIRWSFLPSAICVFSCLAPLPFILFQHDQIQEIRNKHDAN